MSTVYIRTETNEPVQTIDVSQIVGTPNYSEVLNVLYRALDAGLWIDTVAADLDHERRLALGR